MYELREPHELQNFYNYVVATPSIWGSLADVRFELATGRGVIVEVIPGLEITSAPRILGRFDRSPKAVSPSVLALPFLLEKGWLKSLSVPQDLIDPFRAFSANTRESASARQENAAPSPTPPPTPPCKVNWHAFARIVKQQRIRYLYHFTDSRNLASIREHGGLFSWWQCEKRRIGITEPGGSRLSLRLDRGKGLQDYVRLSFNARQPMMYVASRDGRVQGPTILKIDPSVIYLESTLFSDVNATDSEAHVGGDFEAFKQVGFGIATGQYWNGYQQKRLFQAEVLVKSRVPLDMIKNL